MGTAGCQPAVTPGSVRSYVLAMDAEGQSMDPDAPDAARPDATAQYAHQLKQIFAAMDQFHAKWESAHWKAVIEPPRRVLIFVHGGLNGAQDARQAAITDFQRMQAGQTGIYPIFVNWECGLWSSYGQHLFDERNGRVAARDDWFAHALWPLYLVADLGRAATRAPLVWINQITEDGQVVAADLAAIVRYRGDVSQAWRLNVRRGEALRTYETLRGRFEAHPDRALRVSLGGAEVTKGELAGLGAAYLITSPAKFGLSPLLDAGGKAAWDNMTRRTLMLYEGPDISNVRRRQGAQRSPLYHEPGALATFIQEFRDHVAEETRSGHRYEITLVGHSMGTMVLNEFLRRDQVVERQQRRGFRQIGVGPAATTVPATTTATTSAATASTTSMSASLPSYANIVYLAAACTVRDFQESVIPYLRDHPATNFYNLTLHPTADLRERNGLDIPPRGSLLVWIDDYFAEPRTPLDVTLGRFDNIIEASWVIPPELFPRVTLKAFDLRASDDCRDYSPQKHVHFRSQPYWDPTLWQVATPRVSPTAHERYPPARIQETGSAAPHGL